MFGFDEKKVLLSYVPNKKQKKIVLLLSTLHQDDKIDESTEPAAKPEIITFYNGTKGGVDVVDQMKEEYSVGRMTRRWPMRQGRALLVTTERYRKESGSTSQRRRSAPAVLYSKKRKVLAASPEL